ncbi:hypothetical protein O181_020150 [Austropuccinia psidii MF-1]|uniref:Uncharacterized protein n=1 Tax=Austropuccinia psidii MF-1 TaxID=1389203 RepID=A0A9Q3CD76_9BASI|nr:hypothetical protein [Austropuccinia psidii MF-1]
MPKALQRIPLLKTLNSLQFINDFNSDSDSNIQEDIITSQRYINPGRIYAINDLQTLSSERFLQLCRTKLESFEKLVSQIQDDSTFQNSSQNKYNTAIQLAVALSKLG